MISKSKRIKKLEEQVERLQTRMSNLEYDTTYFSEREFYHSSRRMGTVKSVLADVLTYLGLELKWHEQKDGYSSLEKKGHM